jgi:lysophospholipase L1-like esterase
MPLSGSDDDSLHPNPSGYVFMAGAWYDALKMYLK